MPKKPPIADEFLAHAAAIHAERDAAAREGRAPRLAQLLDRWGGATIAYRRRLIDAPSYTLNHEEVAKAMEEGVRFAEGLTPRAVEVDEYGHAAAMRFTRADGSEPRCPPAPCWSPPAPSPTPCWPARTAASNSTAGISRRWTRAGAPVSPVRGLAKPDVAAGADAPRRQRPLRQLLRRPAPELLRQRGEGDGRGEARLSRRVAAYWRRKVPEDVEARIAGQCQRPQRRRN